MFARKACLLLLSVFVLQGDSQSIKPLKKTLLLFSHGIADTYRQAQWYSERYSRNSIIHTNNNYLFSCPWLSFNYPDATLGLLSVNYKETSFGQKNEIFSLNKAYNKLLKYAYDRYQANYNIILFGISRGASNLFIFAGSHTLTNVKAILAESPFYSFDEVISHIMKKTRLEWLPLSYGQSVAEFIFKKYDRNGASPAKLIEAIPNDLPILIICSKEDSLVHYSSSINIYKKFVQCGNTKVHILILDHGAHAKLINGSDGKKYQAVVHAFYKKYDLPYQPSIADAGEKYFLKTQPSLDTIYS